MIASARVSAHPAPSILHCMSSSADKTESFVQQLAENQNRLLAYIYSLVGDHSRAADVLQETNLVLWRKLDEFQADRPFLPWSYAIARFQVLAHLRDRGRDRILLDPDLAESISEEAERQAAVVDDVQVALRTCLQSLSKTNRKLIQLRYFDAKSVKDVSASVERSVGSVKVALLRARRQLAECVQSRVATEMQ